MFKKKGLRGATIPTLLFIYLREENCIWSVIPDCLISPQNSNHNLKYFLQCSCSVPLEKRLKQVWPISSFSKTQWQAGRNLWIKNQSDESNAGICNVFVYICFFLKRKFEIWASFQWVLHRKIEENTILLARSKSLRQRSAPLRIIYTFRGMGIEMSIPYAI